MSGLTESTVLNL
jgi:hypothetical protein